MTSDLDIYRAAKLLIDQHGEKAAMTAADRADLLFENGDLEGLLTFPSQRNRSNHQRGARVRPLRRVIPKVIHHYILNLPDHCPV